MFLQIRQRIFKVPPRSCENMHWRTHVSSTHDTGWSKQWSVPWFQHHRDLRWIWSSSCRPLYTIHTNLHPSYGCGYKGISRRLKMPLLTPPGPLSTSLSFPPVQIDYIQSSKSRERDKLMGWDVQVRGWNNVFFHQFHITCHRNIPLNEALCSLAL